MCQFILLQGCDIIVCNFVCRKNAERMCDELLEKMVMYYITVWHDAGQQHESIRPNTNGDCIKSKHIRMGFKNFKLFLHIQDCKFLV